MPQKKNPDILELIRGKSSLVIGNLMQAMVLLKALPSTYNRDLQEDKKILFDAVGETARSLSMFSRLMSKISFNRDIIREKLESGFPEATDMADYLVKKGKSFRDAYHLTGSIVRYCIENSKKISDMKMGVLKSYSPLFEKDIYDKLKLESCLAVRDIGCGTSLNNVKNSIKQAKKMLSLYKTNLKGLKKRTADLKIVIDTIK